MHYLLTSHHLQSTISQRLHHGAGPKDEPALKARVVTAVAFLVGGKVCVRCVCVCMHVCVRLIGIAFCMSGYTEYVDGWLHGLCSDPLHSDTHTNTHSSAMLSSASECSGAIHLQGGCGHARCSWSSRASVKLCDNSSFCVCRRGERALSIRISDRSRHLE